MGPALVGATTGTTRTLLLLTAAGAVAAAAWAEEPTPIPLTAGAVIERAIATGETQRYTIELSAGEYLQASIEQHGADVKTVVIDAGGRPVLENDCPSADYGQDPLAFVAAAGGHYTLEVVAPSRVLPPGRYTLRVEAVRLPSEADLLRVKAVSATAAGSQLRGQGQEGRENAQRAIARLEEALAAWNALGERRPAMWVENLLGTIHAEYLGQYATAQEHYSRALEHARAAGDELGEASVLPNLAQAHMKAGRFDEARAYIERSIALHHAAGRAHLQGAALMALGSLSLRVGELQKGVDAHQEARRIFGESGDRRREALARTHLAAGYLHLGDYDLALDQFEQALPVFATDRRLRSHTLGLMGFAYERLGDRPRARAAFEEAVSGLEALGNHPAAADSEAQLAMLERDSGNVRLAVEKLKHAVSVLDPVGDAVHAAAALCELGETYRQLGDHDAARQALEAATALAPPADVRAGICLADRLGRLELDVGRLDAAARHAEKGQGLAEAVRASVLGPQARASTLAAHHDLYELLVEIRMRQHQASPSEGHDREALEVSERARARSLLDLLAPSRVDVREGVDPTLSSEKRALVQRLNAAAQALEEGWRTRSSEATAAAMRDMDELAARADELWERMRRASPHYAELAQPQPLSVARIQDQVLDADTLLLEYALGDAESHLWVVSSTGVRSYRLAARAEIERAARALYERLQDPPPHGGARTTAGPWLEATELSRLVLAPAAGDLGHKRLLIVAPGMLQYVPFGALPDPQTTLPLLARHETVTAQSASVLGALRGDIRRTPPASHAVAVLADPVFDASDPRVGRSATAVPASTPPALERALRSWPSTGQRPALSRLPFSGREADAVAEVAPRGDVRKAVGFAASRTTAVNPALADYRILHIATHGLIDTQRPELSGIVLSLVDARGAPQDGFLRLDDIYNLRLGADLVVLSACRTALGRDVRGEGLVGLTRGFMYAGARSVVASLWQVDDESTAELMKRFYRAMLKDHRPPSEALRIAQLEVSRDQRWAAPFYWAGFVLQGEWR